MADNILKIVFEKEIIIENGFIKLVLSDDPSIDGYNSAHIHASGVQSGKPIGFTLGGDYKNIVPRAIFDILMRFEKCNDINLIQELKKLGEELNQAGFAQFENFG